MINKNPIFQSSNFKKGLLPLIFILSPMLIFASSGEVPSLGPIRIAVKYIFHKVVIIILLSFSSGLASVNAQILQDTASLNLIKKGIDCIYNLQFQNADEIYNKIVKIYPQHPFVEFFKGMMIYWENYPLTSKSGKRTSFEECMRNCIKLSKTKKNLSAESEYLLADLCARGMLITFYANNDLTRDVIPLFSSTYQDIRRSFKYTSIYSDFYFFTGLYNYYREAYPKAHPFYKPLVFLFPKGNISKGIMELQTASAKSLLLKAESYSILSYIFMSYENNYLEACNYSRQLHELFPANLEYLAEYIKNLLLVKDYDEAENLMRFSENNASNSYFRGQLSVFNGILTEKKYHNNEMSQKYYNTGITYITAFGAYGNEFAAYTYFGLSRISSNNGDKNKMKYYHKKALELADIKKLNFDK